MNKRLLSMFLALCMVMTLLPVSAMAEEIHTPIGTSGEIIRFAPLTETEKTVSLGTPSEDLKLPETLTATVRTALPSAEDSVQDSGSPETATPTTAAEPEWEETTVDIPVKWESTPAYDMDAEGEYVFTPVIGGYDVRAELPEITVTVGELPPIAARGLFTPMSATTYDIWVGGVQVTDINKGDVLGAADGEGATVIYDNNTNTLTLNGATITDVYNTTIDTYDAQCGIYSKISNLKLVVTGTNGITSTTSETNKFSYAIYTTNKLDISESGSGSLTAVSDGASLSYGIYSKGSLTISSGTITSTSKSSGVAYSIGIDGQSIEILGGDVTATAIGTTVGTAPIGIRSSTDISIAGGKATAKGEKTIANDLDSRGIKGNVVVTGGTVTAQGATQALDGSLMTSGYTGCIVTASTNENGTSAVTYDAANLASYKYLKFEPSAGVTEQFTLTPGGTYYFDLSGEKSNIGTVNTALPDTTLHYVPFTYAGTVNAYSLDSTSSGNKGSSAAAIATDRSLFVGDYHIGTEINWNSLNTASLIFGKPFDTNYTLRSLSAGSKSAGSGSVGQPNTNEWDQILDKSGSTDNTTGWIKNWREMFSWAQDTSTDDASKRAHCGYYSAHFRNFSSEVLAYCGFRPALEVLNPDTLTPDGLKAVTLNLNGGKLKDSTADINIICAGDDFKAPSGEGLTAPTGKTFDGWKDSSGATTYAVGAHVPNTVTGLTAQWAIPATAYDIWVGEVQVTSANASDVLGDGTVSYTPAGGGAAQTLSLKGAKIGAESQYRWDSTTVVSAKAYAAVYAKESLNVVLTGNNSLTGGSQGADKDESYGLYCGGALTITGGGALEAIGATMNKTSCVSYGLFVKGTLSIGDGTTVTARGGDISGGNGVSFGVFGKDGGLTVENATLTVASGTGYNSFGVRIMQGDISITNSDVTVTSGTTSQYSRALEADAGNISISGGTVSASAENGASPAYCIAIYVPAGKNITISSSAVVTARAGSAGYGGRAMSQAPNLDSYGSEYYITASRAYNGGSPETYNASSIIDYRYLDMRQRTATPTTGTTSASKSSASQNSISFTLTNSSAYTSALIWKVYSGSTGQILANGVTATKSGNTLTLSHAVNIPAATYYVAVTESGKAESGRLALTVGAFVPASLTGTATISNTAPRIGDTLTASLVGGNNTGTLNYVWKAGGAQVGTGASYTVTAANFGAAITLEITSSVETGTVSSAPTTAVAKKAAPAAPVAPTLLLKTNSYVMLTANSNYDFSKDGINWQAANTFTGLSANTPYTFYQRFSEKWDTEPSAASVGFEVTTDAATYTITANPASKNFGSLATGYSAPAAQTVTITNTGNSSLALTQPSSTNYTIGALSTTTLAANGTATFTVTPKTGLAVGNYNETLTVSTDHSTNATVSLSFSVTTVPTYTITANPTSKDFGSQTVGYTAPAAQTVTITNTGNSSVTLTQPSSTNYTIGTLSATTLAAGGTATFTITPKAGLAVGNYNETLTVSTDHSTNATVNLSFSVMAVPTYTITANPTSKNFDSLAVGYSAPAAQTVTITNTGNTSVTLTQPTSTNYTIGALSATTLATNGTATFTVAPKAGLAVGNYNETLTVNTDHSTNATVELSFSVTAVPTYIVTFNPNGGTVSETSRSVASGTAVGTLPTPTRSGSYSFDGWYTAASGGTQISASTTASANVTYYAHWTYTGGGGSGSGGGSSSNDNSSSVIVTPPAPDKPNSPTQGEIKVSGTVDSKSNVTVNISGKTVTDAFEKALADAKKNGNEQNGITVILHVDTGSKTGSNITVNLPKTVQDTIIVKKIVNTIVVVDNPDIRIGMNLATVQEINKQAKSDVNITATRGDSSKLTGDAKKAIGSRPVFDLKVNYGNGKEVSSFGTGSVSVTIPYTLGANEKAGNVQAVYVDAKGKVHWLTNSVYDSVEKVLRFSTDHFSTYGIGYKQTNTAFTDIAAHWAKEDIEFMVSRGLFSGTSNTTFSPSTAMTRGMFVTALGRLANADVSGYAKSSFTDVKGDAYYMGYIEWASKNNIVNGTGNNKFAPDQSITREQMAVIMSNYAKTIGYTLPKVHVENIFTDNAKISAYAKDAVKQMQMAGVISGKNGNLFDPQGTATRAEVSAVLRRFVELAISSDTMQGWTRNDSGQWMYYENGKPLTGKKEIDGTTYTFDQYGVTADAPKNLRYTTYTVQKGDSFWSISRKLNCTMAELERLNNKSRFALIHPGDVLQVPEK
ncbi:MULTISPECIES: S-layer homology domain-containing protein [unclassified Lacrimispora]|uniref:S-layer homology domain-containing protein n=1 Tax=unclassified Lacrimispora TaxID=2719232 RepID=UPI00377075A1